MDRADITSLWGIKTTNTNIGHGFVADKPPKTRTLTKCRILVTAINTRHGGGGGGGDGGGGSTCTAPLSWRGLVGVTRTY